MNKAKLQSFLRLVIAQKLMAMMAETRAKLAVAPVTAPVNTTTGVLVNSLEVATHLAA